MNVRDAKREIRQATEAARDALTPEWRALASSRIAQRIGELESFARASVILVTLPFRSEWDASLVAASALAEGKVVAAPRVDPRRRMLAPLRIVSLERDIENGDRGIPEPRATCAAIALDSIDWILVPGLAFDEVGHRLGYGGGYYDRLLPLLPRSAARVAGAFDVQIATVVPTAPHDLAVDCIVTETRVLSWPSSRE